MESENDIELSEIMEKSKLEMPFSNFEDDLMQQIRKREVRQKSYLQNVTMSWLCFFTGTVVGILITYLLPQMPISAVGLPSETVVQIFQVVFALFILFSLDILIRYTRKVGLNKLFDAGSFNIPFLRNGR